VSGAVLPEHQAEAETAADATAAAERGHDEAANGSDEFCQNESEQLASRECSAEEHRKFDSGHHSADDAVTAVDTSGDHASASRTAASHETARAFASSGTIDAATAPRDGDAGTESTTGHERRSSDDEPRRQAGLTTDARSSRGSSEGSRGSAAAVEPATRPRSRLRRQEPADDDVASAADGQRAHGSAGASHDGRRAATTAAVAAATTTATAAATAVSQPNATTQPDATATNANGCTRTGTTATASTTATAGPTSTAWSARPASAA